MYLYVSMCQMHMCVDTQGGPEKVLDLLDQELYINSCGLPNIGTEN